MDRVRPEYDMVSMGKKMQYYRKLWNISVEEVRQYMHFFICTGNL